MPETMCDPEFEQNELIAMTEARHKLQVELTAMTAMAENFKSRFVEASRANVESTERIAALERVLAQKEQQLKSCYEILAAMTRERDEIREYADGAVENHKITLEERNAARAEVERLRFDLRQIRAQQKQDCAEVERLKMLLRDGASDSTPEQHAAWVKRRRAALGEGE